MAASAATFRKADSRTADATGDSIGALLPTASGAGPSTHGRLESLDATRAAFVLLGVLFHAALPYHVDGYWMVNDPSDSTLLTALATFVHSFRMPGFFMIAGILFELAIRNANRSAFMQRRTMRLGVPMILTLLTCNVLQYELVAHFHAESCGTGPGPCLSSDPRAAIGLGHLWFLAVLLVVSLIYSLLRDPIARMIDGIAGRAAAPRAPVALIAAFAGAYATWEVGSLLLQKLPGLGTDWFGFSAAALLFGLYFFLAGVFIARVPALLARLQTVPSAGVLLGLLVAGVMQLVAAESLAGTPSLPLRLSEIALRSGATVCNVLAATYVSTLVFRRLQRPMRFLANYSYPVYLVHQVLIVAAAFIVASSPVPALAKFIVVLTFAFSMAFLIALLLDRSPEWVHVAVGARGRASLRRRGTSRRSSAGVQGATVNSTPPGR